MELYDTLGMKQNAAREAKTLLDADARNEKALAMVKRLRE